MKILVINSSHRGDAGYTRFLIDKLVKGAEEAGAECEVVTLAKLNINRCLSCGKCNTKDHFLRCVYDDKDDVRGIFNKMAEADLIVFATPIYIFTITGLLKTFLDRLYSTGNAFELRMTDSGMFFHHVNPDICSKPMAVLICCDNIEEETPRNAITFFKTYSKFHDAPLVGMLVRNAGRFTGHGKDPDAHLRAPKLPEVYAAFVSAGRELALNGRIQPSTQKRACQNILPVPPWHNLVKNLRSYKSKMMERARQAQKFTEGDV